LGNELNSNMSQPISNREGSCGASSTTGSKRAGDLASNSLVGLIRIMIAPVVTFQFSALLSVLVSVVIFLVKKELGPVINHFPSSAIVANVFGWLVIID